jgi:hypothetical protein
MPFAEPRYFTKRRIRGRKHFVIRTPHEHQEILFKRKNDHIRLKVKLTKERALAVTGIKTVYWLQDFERYYSK